MLEKFCLLFFVTYYWIRKFDKEHPLSATLLPISLFIFFIGTFVLSLVDYVLAPGVFRGFFMFLEDDIVNIFVVLFGGLAMLVLLNFWVKKEALRMFDGDEAQANFDVYKYKVLIAYIVAFFLFVLACALQWGSLNAAL